MDISSLQTQRQDQTDARNKIKNDFNTLDKEEKIKAKTSKTEFDEIEMKRKFDTYEDGSENIGFENGEMQNSELASKGKMKPPPQILLKNKEAKASEQSSEESISNEGIQGAPRKPPAGGKMNIDTTETEDNDNEDEDDEIDSNELYSYTDSELKDLLIENKISRSEYIKEMESRNSQTTENITAEGE